MPVYCGDMRSHNVRASSGKRSKKAHSRSRCRKVAKGNADAACVYSSRTKRCQSRSAAAKRFNAFKYVSQRGGASACAKKAQADCAAPCQWRSGSKRRFCTAVGRRGSKKVGAIPVPPPAPMFRPMAAPMGMAMSRNGSLCNAMPEADCKRNSGKANAPCRWVNATADRAAYCGIATKAATMGEGYRSKKGGRQSRQRQQYW